MKLSLLALVIMICFAWIGQSLIQPCPPCPEKGQPCHSMFMVGKPRGCSCQICTTHCFERDNLCGSGKACVLKPVFYAKKKVGETATCVKFERCPELKCENSCPKSGYFKDANGCQTCLCNDPCLEKCSSGRCWTWSTNPGTELNYECEN